MPNPSPSNADSHKLQLLTARKKERWLATAGSSPQAVICQHCDTHYFSRPRTHNLPMLVRRATSSAYLSVTGVSVYVFIPCDALCLTVTIKTHTACIYNHILCHGNTEIR